MSFIADKQTLEDLNLLGKYKQHSVFSLFNRVYTRGGEQLLQEIFHHPLSDPELINERSSIFRYFQSKELSFPFSHEQLSGMEDYLSSDSGKSYLASFLTLLKKKVLHTVVNDPEYQLLVDGLRHTIVVLNACREFLAHFKDDQDNPFKDQILKATNILNDPRLDWLERERNKQQWELGKLAWYDHLLRTALRNELNILTGIFFQLDLYIAVGNLAREKGFSYARAVPAEINILSAEGLSHPCIDNAVANPVSFHQKNNLIFLTGANMAGKSTFMKSLGISLYLAHMGFPLAATNMTFSVKEGIYSSINVPDDLNQGYSHFYAEVLRVKTVAEQVASGKNLVVIFDELFKGTNVKDAYDATLAVTAAFSAYRNCFFVISTHIIEVGETLKQQYENMQFLYLPTLMEDNRPVYTYQIRPGISGDRHGMVIIENEKILELLIPVPANNKL